MDLKETEGLSPAEAAAHWYYVSKGRAVMDLIGREPVERLLDVGAGVGVFSRQLIEAGLTGEAVCVDPGYDEDSEEAVPGGRILYRRSGDGVRAPLVLMMDVLEHVPDDLALVKEYMDDAAPGTRLLVTVPAFQSLWSGHDVFLEHYRRYRAPEVADLLERAGLAVKTSRYFFGLMFPAVAAVRLADRVRTKRGGEVRSSMAPAPALLNRALIAVHDVERRMLFPFNRAAGVSVVALAEKPAPTAH